MARIVRMLRHAPIGLALLTFGGCDTTIRLERRLDASGLEHVSIVNFGGEVAIESWSDGRALRARIGISGDQEAVEGTSVSISRAGNTATLVVSSSSGRALAEVALKVPRGISFEVVNAEGPVYALGSFSAMSVRTTHGMVRIFGADGPVDVETTLGSVNVEGNIPSFRIKTDVGRIRIASDHPGPLVAGSEAEVERGRIGVTLPSAANMTVDAETGRGRLANNLGLTMEEREAGARMAGDIGGGGATMKLRVGIGTIGVWRAIE